VDSASGMDSASRRQLTGTLLLAALGGALILMAAGRPWASVTVPRQPPFGVVRLALTGRALFPALTGLAVVALIAAVLMVVIGGWPRRLLGALLVLLAGWTGWYAAHGLGRPSNARVLELGGDRLSQRFGRLVVHSHPLWAGLALVGSACLLAAGLILLARSGGWRTGLSSRHAAPVEAAQGADPWRQLDRGEDPTIRDG
jgi:uncharacterized membrane protein (TIGR02234 family)